MSDQADEYLATRTPEQLRVLLAARTKERDALRDELAKISKITCDAGYCIAAADRYRTHEAVAAMAKQLDEREQAIEARR